MARMRTKTGKIKIIEKKVEDLDTSVKQVQESLGSLTEAQTAANTKLDNLIRMFSRNFPTTEPLEMEIEADDGNRPSYVVRAFQVAV